MGRNIVYIFGAGSSRDFGYPLGFEIFDYADKVFANADNQEIKTKLEIYIKECDNVMSSIYSNLPPDKRQYPLFEEVLTFIWQSRKYEYQNDKGEIVRLFAQGAHKVLKNFVEMLMLVFSGLMHSDRFKSELELYEAYIKSLNFNDNNVTIISLNYDLIIDKMLSVCVKEGIIEDFNYGIGLDHLGKESHYISIYPAQGHDFQFHLPVDGPHYRTGGISLLKPHGSLNLSFCTGHKREGDFYYYSEDDVTLEILNKTKRARCSVSNCHDCVTPLIIPPLYMKESYVTETNKSKVWISKRGMRTMDTGVIENYRLLIDNRINDALQNADELVIVGYSMPPYDFDFKSLLMKGMMANKKRANLPINIINKGERWQLEDLKLRFNHLGGEVNFIGENGLLDYIKSNGTGVGPSQLPK